MSKTQRMMIAAAIDNDDGHTRITTSETFVAVGGSERTHERMTETLIKTNEELKRRGKHLQTIDPRELRDIMHESRPKE